MFGKIAAVTNLMAIPLIRWGLYVLIIGAALALPRWFIGIKYADKISPPSQSPTRPVALVFGAGLFHGRPSRVLADRVRTAVALYDQGSTGLLLMSGTRLEAGYDEPLAMKNLAVELGVPARDVLLDPGGTRTFESCLRAREVFGFQQVLLVSQRYHLPRALATCDALGIDAVGISADLRPYRPQVYRFWQIREIPATLVALWDAYIQSPQAELPAHPAADPSLEPDDGP